MLLKCKVSLTKGLKKASFDLSEHPSVGLRVGIRVIPRPLGRAPVAMPISCVESPIEMNQRLAVPQPEPSALKRLRLAASAPCHLSVPWGLIFVILIAGLLPAPNEARRVPSRRAIDDCRGNIVPLFEQYNARLDRLCDECYEIYRDQSIRDQCSKDCYRNEVFRDCLQALMIKQEMGDVYKMINTLAG